MTAKVSKAQSVSLDESTSNNSRWKGKFQFLLAVGMILFVWGNVLPRMAQDPEMHRQIEAREKNGIDLGAMFYTDLEAAAQAEEKLHRLNEKKPNALWIP